MLASVSFGQKADPFDLHVADYRLLLSRKIQTEVGISLAQRDQLNKLADAERAKAMPYLKEFQKTHSSANDLQRDKTYQGFLAEMRSKVLAVLNPGELKRLRELSLQSVDLGGVMDVIVSTRIGMSPSQLAKARQVFSAGIQRSQAIITAVNNQVIAQYNQTKVKSAAEAKALNATIEKQRQEGLKKHDPELHQIELETKRQIEAVLTPKQLAAYRALEGKPYSLK